MPNQLPVEQVRNFRDKGYNDNQIVQQLQKQGFASQQIFDAMAQADINKIGGVEAGPSPGDYPEAMPPQPETPSEPAPEYSQPYPYPQAQPQPYQAYPETSEEKISEVAEAIINEKWEELIAEVKKITDWKESTESAIQKNSDEINRLKEEFNELRRGILGKISEYDGHMRDVSSELKAVEKVFQDTIPSFTENVRELSRITKNIKSKKD